jgi:large repetitive protein
MTLAAVVQSMLLRLRVPSSLSPASLSGLVRALLLALAGLACTPLVAQSASPGEILGGNSGAFNHPGGVAVDASGNVYVANSTVNEVDMMPAGCASPSCVTPLAQTGGNFASPLGMAVDGKGNVYVTGFGDSTVKEILAVNGSIPANPTVNILGSGFSAPGGVAVDGNGNVYVADTFNNAVKEILAVNGSIPANKPTINILGSFDEPEGVALDGSGNVYITSAGDGTVKEMLAVSGSIPASPTINTLATGFTVPFGVAVDGSGDVYLSAAGQNEVKEILAVNGSIPASPTIQTINFSGGFSGPEGVAVDGNGNLYVADQNNDEVKEIIQHGVNLGSVAVNTVTPSKLIIIFTFTAGASNVSVEVPTQGATGLDFSDSGFGTCDTNGILQAYSSGDSCTVVLSFTPKFAGLRLGALELLGSGVPLVTMPIYGTGTGPQAAFAGAAPTTQSSGYSTPDGVAVDAAGIVFVADATAGAVFEVTPSGVKTTFASGFSKPVGVAVDGAGNVYVANEAPANVFKIPPVGTQTTVGSGLLNPKGVAVDGAGNVFVTDISTSTVSKITPAGTQTTVGSGFNSPDGVAVDAAGNVYVADQANAEVFKITPAGTQTTVGSGFVSPSDVTVDAAGDVYVSDHGTDAVDEVTPGGAKSTLGSAFNVPGGLAIDSSGNLYVADIGNQRIAEIERATAPSVSFATTTNVGSTDTIDGAKTVLVSNIGNQPLNFTAVSQPADFSEASVDSSACTSTTSLSPAGECDVPVEFTPHNAGSPLSENVTLTDNALNITGAQQTIAVSGTAVAVPLAITGASSTTFTVGLAGSFTVMANSTSAPTFSETGALPSGVSFSSAGVLSGTPLGVSGNYPIMITASNGVSPNATQSFTLILNPGPAATLALTAPSSATAGVPIAYTVTAHDISGNVATSYGGTVAFTSTDPNAVLPASSAIANGTGTFSATLKTVGNQTLTATDTTTSTTKGTSNTITVNPPQSFVVTTTADSNDGSCGSTCSLRDAITAANAAGAGNITFASGLGSAATPGKITLVNGPLTLSRNVAITGLGTTALVLDGNSASSSNTTGNILQVTAGVTASVSNLTMQNAAGLTSQLGGAVYNDGTLTLAGVLVQNSSSNGQSGGAGIYNDAAGVLTLNQTTLANNTSSFNAGSSGQGGAILNNGGSLTMTASTLSGNEASLLGGNLFTNGGTVVIANSTITGSVGTTVGGGLGVTGGTVTLTDSTIAFNNASFNPGVQVSGGGTVTVTNSIVAANGSATSTGNCPGCTLGAGNLIDLNPQLSVLGSYGGPTQTLVPLAGSPAVCLGVATSISTDQRGFARPAGSCFDIGAAQTEYAIAFVEQPTNTLVNTAIAPAVKVAALDHGIGIPGSAINLTLTGAGTLSGTLPELTDTLGTATFPDLNVNTVAAGDTLTATAGSALTVTSNPFNITSGAAAITFSPNPATQVYGTAVTSGSLDATDSSGGSTVAGTFAYTTTINGLANQTVTAGTTVLPVGNYTITASFTPSNSTLFSATSTTAGYSVTQAPQTITFTPPASPVSYGAAAIMLSATGGASGNAIVFSVVSGPGTITGSTLTVTGVGTIVIAANQAGNANYSAATQVTRSLVVNNATPTIGLVSSANPVLAQNAITLTATVSSSIGTPTGTVTFLDGATVLGSGTLTRGEVTFTTSSLAVGSYSITAAYAGDANFAAGVSSVLTETVEDFSFSISSVSVTAPPSGTAVFGVTFTPVNATTFPASVALAVSGLPAGATATFSPATLPAGSAATTVTLTVELPAATAALDRERGTGKLAPFALALLLLPFGGCMPKSAKRLGRVVSLLLLLGAGISAMAGLTGCGASDNRNIVQTQQTYDVTVTGTSGTLSHSATFKLTVE